jgi:isoleucyl-tRNA synthetase
VYVTFPLVDNPDVKFVAWTTTPWTLPSNLALCVNPNMDYVTVKDNASGQTYIIAECLIHSIFPAPKKAKKGDPLPYTILSKCKGTDLKGTRYVPLFNYFAQVNCTFTRSTTQSPNH